MATIIGVETLGGVALAADRRHVQTGTARNDRVDRIYDLGDAICAAIGDPGNVAAFHRTLDAEVDQYQHDHDQAPTIDAIAEMAGRVASTTGVRALVAGRTDSGTAELRVVDAEGGVLHDTVAALGSGAAPALAALDDVTTDAPIDDVADELQDVLANVHERDPESGPNSDVVTFAAH